MFHVVYYILWDLSFKIKFDVYTMLKHFQALVENLFDTKIKFFKSDRGHA